MNEHEVSLTEVEQGIVPRFVATQLSNLQELRARDLLVAGPAFAMGMWEIVVNRDDPVRVARGVGAVIVSFVVGSTGKH